ncbi:hypothetical protein [Pseudofrankia sp. DC12]|uniref:hypothetical protein n=1 Tax=Pseudofrankia sp. DC12 TaxID=683315 RepID=UPI0005F82758|nr:hypothetical protein [Pseudofrankia sp. DC12]
MGDGNGRGDTDRPESWSWSRDGGREGATARPLGAPSASRARAYRASPELDVEVWDAELVDEPWDPAVARSAEDVEIIDAAALDAIAQRLSAAAGVATDEPVAGGPPRPGSPVGPLRPGPADGLPGPGRPGPEYGASPAGAAGPVPRPAASAVRRRHRPQPAWRTGLERLSAQVAAVAGPSRLARVRPAGWAPGRRVGRVPLGAMAGAVVLLLLIAGLVIVLFGQHSGFRTGAARPGGASQGAEVSLAPGGLGLTDGSAGLGGAGGSDPAGGQGAEPVSGVQAEPVQGLGMSVTTGPTRDNAAVGIPDTAGSTPRPAAGASAHPSGADAGLSSPPAATPTGPRCYRADPLTAILLGVVGMPTC